MSYYIDFSHFENSDFAEESAAYDFEITEVGIDLGSIIYVSTDQGYEHCALLVGYSEYGDPIVFSIASGRGSYYETLGQMLNGRPILRIQYPGKLPWWQVVARAEQIAKKPYSWISWNCEHFTSYAHGLKPRSPQVERAALVFGGVALTLIAVAASK